jgi:uncharacterized damage-inducible protein DinB
MAWIGLLDQAIIGRGLEAKMNMKDILNLYAKYNKHANSEVIRVLGTVPESRLHEATGSYYKSLAGLLNHSLRSTVGSLKRMADGGLLPSLLLPVVGTFPQAAMGETIFATLPEFAALRAKADDALVALCGGVSAEELEGTFSFMGRDNQQKTLSFGGNLLALYTHEVHHRGGVSTILDGWGVENDWSGLMRFLFL